MNTQTLNARLTSLFDAHKQTVNLIHRLSKLPVQPGSSSQDPEAGDARVELSAEIHQSLKEQEEDFELVRQAFEDQANSANRSISARRRDSIRDKERATLAAQVTRLGEDLRSSRTQFRKAQLQAKRNAEAVKRKERELLFGAVQEDRGAAGQSRRKGQEKLTQDELILNASNDVTAALRRTHALMQTEVSRSQFANETLQQSTAALSTLSESYNDLDTLLSSSRSLVSSLLHSQKSDTWYLESSIWILIITISWLVFRRLLYGPGWWLLYLPTKLLWRSTFSIIQLLIGASASIAGNFKSASQSGALSNSSTSLIVKPSATGGIPKFDTRMSAPSVNVGGGGSGAKGQGYRPPPQSQGDPEGKSLTEEIGKMAEETQRQAREGNEKGTVLRERTSEETPNPKKRVWEEPVDPSQQRPRDEL